MNDITTVGLGFAEAVSFLSLCISATLPVALLALRTNGWFRLHIRRLEFLQPWSFAMIPVTGSNRGDAHNRTLP